MSLEGRVRCPQETRCSPPPGEPVVAHRTQPLSPPPGGFAPARCTDLLSLPSRVFDPRFISQFARCQMYLAPTPRPGIDRSAALSCAEPLTSHVGAADPSQSRHTASQLSARQAIGRASPRPLVASHFGHERWLHPGCRPSVPGRELHPARDLEPSPGRPSPAPAEAAIVSVPRELSLS